MGMMWELFTPFCLGIVNQVSIKGSSQLCICDLGKMRDFVIKDIHNIHSSS